MALSDQQENLSLSLSIEKRHVIATFWFLATDKKKVMSLRYGTVLRPLLSCAFVSLLLAFASKSNKLQKLISLRIDLKKISKQWPYIVIVK